MSETKHMPLDLDGMGRLRAKLEIASREMANGRPINGGDLEDLDDLLEGLPGLIEQQRELVEALTEAAEIVRTEAASLRDSYTAHSTGVVDEDALPEIERLEAAAERARAALAKALGTGPEDSPA